MQTERPATTALPIDDDPNPEFFQLVWEKIRGKGMKYSLVSVVNVLFGGGLLLFFVGPLDLGATKSNMLAVAISAVPAYFLNRRWVWEQSGRSDMKTEVAPFLGFVVAGWALSSISVHYAAARFPESNIVPNVANLGAFGILWVLRFFILDRLFQKPHEDFYEVVAEELTEFADHIVHHDSTGAPGAPGAHQ